jgi:hypothetical protein
MDAPDLCDLMAWALTTESVNTPIWLVVSEKTAAYLMTQGVDPENLIIIWPDERLE